MVNSKTHKTNKCIIQNALHKIINPPFFAGLKHDKMARSYISPLADLLHLFVPHLKILANYQKYMSCHFYKQEKKCPIELPGQHPSDAIHSGKLLAITSGLLFEAE